jgi:hypothetical protein
MSLPYLSVTVAYTGTVLVLPENVGACRAAAADAHAAIAAHAKGTLKDISTLCGASWQRPLYVYGSLTRR